MKKIVMFLCLSFSVHLLMAQVPDSLKLRLVGKAKLSDIMREVEDYYKNDKSAKRIGNNGEVEFENDYLHWKRWEYYQGSRLDEQGKIIPDVNAKIFEEFKKYQSLQKNTKSPQSSYSGWNAFGPTTVTRYGAGYNSGYGRVNCIAFHPSNANYLLIGTPQGGIWKSFNNGTSWFSLTDNLPSNGIGGLVWDRTNVNVIYALTGDADASGSGFVSSYGYNIPSLGVFKSTDGGTTWGTTGPFPNVTGNFYGYKLIQHPTNANILFAATTAGIFETTDGGDTWVRQVIGNFTDIEFKPGNPTIMYAAQLSSTSPFWRSTNSGDTWTNSGFTNVPFNSNRIAIGVSNNQPNYIYLLAGPSTGSGMYVGLFRSTGAFTP